jgi:aminoglycoside phosphotransferase (APT) family kinase protein
LVSWQPSVGKVQRLPPGSCTAIKTYPHSNTLRFKCWGSGASNERIARELLGDVVPSTLELWYDDAAEYARLEWIDGVHFDPARMDEADLVAAGRLLGRIHSTHGAGWGSLDGAYAYPDPASAFAARFAAAVALLAEHDVRLARQVSSWSLPLLAWVRWDGPSTLVHGDYGLANLIRRQGRIHVLDWEHARWGHPEEDWTKIRLVSRFPEPSGFGRATEALPLLEEGWSAVTGRPAPRSEPAGTLLAVYFAMCLGTFFAVEPNPRLRWLRGLLDDTGCK